MMVCQTVIDSVAEHRRRNVDGQMDLFGLSGDTGGHAAGGIDLPDVPEYTKGDLMRMEREVTGLYLSGHPMDEFASTARSAGAVGIGEILADFAREDGNIRFADDQQIVVAGVVESVRTKPTRNNTLMAYLGLDDGSGSIELLAFQRVIDESGVYMQASTLVLVAGRLSARDEKAPQIVVNALRPITGGSLQLTIDNSQLTIRNSQPTNHSSQPTSRNSQSGTGSYGGNPRFANRSSQPPSQGSQSGTNGRLERTLFVKLRSEDSPEYERLKLIHMMFPGRERMVIHFSDIKKSVGAKCVIHDALVAELREMLGAENVIVK